MNITIDMETMEAIKSFQDSPDPRWERIRKCIFDNAESLSREIVHAVPAGDDSNFNTRHHMNRGIAIAFDLLKDSITNVDEIVNDERKRVLELQQIRDMTQEEINAHT